MGAGPDLGLADIVRGQARREMARPAEGEKEGAELRASCERRGGWWRGSLIPDYCEFQGAALMEAP
jgi:hypothetical protein